MTFLRFLAAALSAAALCAFATPQPINATDLWVDPDELGWGVSVFHQGDTLFASLFVYGPDGQPKWYTASGMTSGPFVFSGPLTEATGPSSAGAFDPNRVTRRTVGTMTFTLRESDATLSYSVDGVQVSKRVVRFSMRPINLGGAYYGVMLQPAGSSGPEKSRYDQHIVIQDDTSRVSLITDSNTTSSCNYDSTSRSQDGELVAAGAAANPNASPIYNGCYPWRFTVDRTATGFFGNFTGSGISDGRIAASLRGPPVFTGNGWVNDLWFPPDESGWGFNVIEQGDSVFGTLFVFDEQGRPHWYSASQLTRIIVFPIAWGGPIYESTGPYFGTSFNPAAVTRRQVGDMTFEVNADGSARLAYSVGGPLIEKRVRRFAFRKNDLSGSYRGMKVMRDDDPRGRSYDDVDFTIDDRGDQVTVSINNCPHVGTSTQDGSLRTITGTYACGFSGQLVGNFRMDNVQVSANGLTSTYQGLAGHISGLITNGHISGARR